MASSQHFILFLNIKNIYKSRYPKKFHDFRNYISNHHFPLLIHDLL